MLTKEKIKAKQDRKREWVATPDWADEGATPEEVAACGVWIGSMSAGARDSYETELLERSSEDGERIDLVGIKTVLVIRTAENEDGSRMFDDDDYSWLVSKSCIPIRDLYEVASRLNKVTKQDVDELTKNSDAGQADSSPTA